MTALQLYFGNDPNLPHASNPNNIGVAGVDVGAGTLQVTITVNNGGASQLQVYVNFYRKVCGQNDIANIDKIALGLMRGGALSSWNNVMVPGVSGSGPGQWTTTFPLSLPGVGDDVVLVATLSCAPLGEAPSLSKPTQDPCVAINFVPYPMGRTASILGGASGSMPNAAASLGLLGLGWLIARRDKLAGIRSESRIVDSKGRRIRK